MKGRWVSLRPVRSADIEAVANLHEVTCVAGRWRAGPGAVPPSGTERALWSSTDLQMIVHFNGDPASLLGVCVAYALDLRNRTCYFALVFDPRSTAELRRLEAVFMFIDDLFDRYQLRRLYAEATDETLASFGVALRRGFVKELTLPGFGWSRDVGSVPRHTLSIDRRTWQATRARALSARGRSES